LSPPIVWTPGFAPTHFVPIESISYSFTATNSQEFFRYLQSYPVFQFNIFYNVNLEIDPGAAMTINGLILCNADIWAGSSTLTFFADVFVVGQVFTNGTDPFATSHYGSGSPAFMLSGQPVSGTAPLYLPIGTNSARTFLDLPPVAYAMGTSAAYSSNGMVYPANGADLVITNFPNGTNYGTSGTNLIMYFQNGGLTQIPYDFYTLKTGGSTNYIIENNSAGKDAASNVLFAGFSWVTNVAF
jgi:hypothetical protein